MRRRRGRSNHLIFFAGLLALLSAIGLIAIVTLSNNPLTNLDPTTHQRTVDAIVQTRLALTADARTLAAATDAAAPSATPDTN